MQNWKKMFFEALENAIKTRLHAHFNGAVDVELEPETNGANTIPTEKGRVTVMYDQSDFEKQNTTAYISQHETAQIAIIIRSRKLRGQNGIYWIAEEIRKSITGYAPESWSKIWLRKMVFVRREMNLWEYSLLISSKSMIVEEHTEPTTPVLISATTQVTLGQ